MNYLNGNLTYEATTLNQITSFYSDGTITQNGAYSGASTIKDTIFNVTLINNKGAPLMVYLPKDNAMTSEGYLFFNVNLDYILYEFASYQVNAQLCKYNEALDTTQTFTSVNDYATYFNGGEEGYLSGYCFEDYDYSYYNTQFSTDSKQSVFDLSNTRDYFNNIDGSDLTGKIWNIYNSRPDNSLYYNYCLKLSGYQLTTNQLTIKNASNTRGSSIFKSWQTAYDNGYGNGYQNGYADGYNHNMDKDTLTAFDYIGTAFSSVGGILEIEVLPHVTLGLVFSIPLVLVVIMTIFKLVKK